ncbi:nucleoside hydrolase [Pelagicoccus mobilis]|uniref:Nucleoside hydrolase n=1 Tax=Pelagicoccus mobilis TaxID=415221 RepID=A0A934S1D0_9BACT|nr:nucleoside hydrolase [Pelagicoccus mobilis]MBK1877644.1 nucleoside hydrolase [Pelagicoccus mobilis]
MLNRIFVWIFAALIFVGALGGAEKRTVVLDADTANEVDDLYAIVRAFAVPEWDIVALNSTQWENSQWKVPETMEASHRLNTALLTYLKAGDETRLRRGGHRRMYDWGDLAVHSAAAYEIIRLANEQEDGDKLTVIAMGALTNVASALFIDPEIENKIALYWLGSTYDREKKSSRLLDFNPMMDPRAAGMLFQSKMEMHVLPVSELWSYQFDFRRTRKELEDVHELGEYLVATWFNHHDSGRERRILWDVALIQAMVYPEKVTEIEAPWVENPNLSLYTDLDTDFFVDEMYVSLKSVLENL